MNLNDRREEGRGTEKYLRVVYSRLFIPSAFFLLLEKYFYLHLLPFLFSIEFHIEWMQGSLCGAEEDGNYFEKGDVLASLAFETVS